MGKGFRFSIVAKVKHGDLREALQKRGWNQRQGADFLGLSQSSFGRLMNLQWIPKKVSSEREKKLFELTGKFPEDLWPEEIRTTQFAKLPKIIEVSQELTPEMLESQGFLQIPYTPEEEIAREELPGVLRNILNELTPLRREAIEEVFFGDKTMAEVARDRGVTTSAVQGMVSQALTKIRNSPHAQKLLAYLEKPR